MRQVLIGDDGRPIAVKITTEVASDVPTLNELYKLVAVNAGATLQVELTAGFSKYDIRTVYFKSVADGVECPVSVTITDQPNGFTVYESQQAVENYDIVSIPTSDKLVANKVYCAVTNYGSQMANVTLQVNITSLQ